MRVALLSYNAQPHNAVGNQIAEKVRFFQERGAEVRLFVQDARRLHPDVQACAVEIREATLEGPAWDYLRQTDLVFAVYAQYHDLLQYLPSLVGLGPRLVFDYHGVTPPGLWHDQHREALEHSVRARGYVWCCDHTLTTSRTNRRELLDATQFPDAHVTTLPLPVDVARFRLEPRDRVLHQMLGIDGRILLYVGRLAGNKRVPLLIEALARTNDPTLHAVIVGDCRDVYAAEADRCLALAAELDVSERVHFIGELSDVDLPRAYRSADLFVMPSLHEGFCVPVIEAMASGCPVIASRSSALPETVGDAGLTFTPDDADDLARQASRVLNDRPAARKPEMPRRVAIVCFRFGPEIVGGAETSLRTMAHALRDAGNHVEIFTTCTQTESNWRNDLSAGSTTLDGLTVQRFPIDRHDSAAHGEVFHTILGADGHVSSSIEERYLAHSIHSSALLESLQAREHEFDAIITGPYLFGLTADIATAFPRKTLVVPCFHDEALARLAQWPRLYGAVGGILYHSVEEKALAQTRLGVNHPNTAIVGTCLRSRPSTTPPATFPRPYVVYCGRYSAQKNVPLLLEWMHRYQVVRPGRLDLVFMGQGELRLANEPWLHNLGRVDENTKRAVLAGANALVQLSRQESLSLVALEAWAEGTPVIAHAACAVLAGQIERSQGGRTVGDFDTFAEVMDDLLKNEISWQERGANGRAYVVANYSSQHNYLDQILQAIDQMQKPIGALMRERGVARAHEYSREIWQRRFAEFVEQVLMQPARPCHDGLQIEPLRPSYHAAIGTRTLLLPIRLTNAGTHAAVPDGPGRTVVCCEIDDVASEGIVVPRAESACPTLLMPGQSQVAPVPVGLPNEPGSYRVRLWMERSGTVSRTAEVGLTMTSEQGAASPSCVASFLDTVAQTLPKTHHLQQLPTEYVDVTEGRLAPVKRLIKGKLLNNFKHAYVDVISRQQSQVNGQLVLMIQQLAECCTMLDGAVTALHERIGKLEKDFAACGVANEPQATIGRPHG